MRCALGLSLLALALTGCPEPARSASEPAACERIGERCVLPDGPIGVCNDTGRTDCASPPCLDCMPQH